MSDGILVLFVMGILAGMLIATIIIGLIRSSKNDNDNDDNCYINGKITNSYAIIILKNIERELNKVLSSTEKNAIRKGIARCQKLSTV